MHFCVFDLDHTLIKTNISFRYCLYLTSLKLIPKRSWVNIFLYLIFYRLQLFSLNTLHKKVFKKWMESENYKQFTRPVNDFLEKHFFQMINPYVWDLLKEHQKKGDYIALFSSSPAFLVFPVAKKLNFHAAFATQYQVDNQGKLCQILTLVDGDKKASLAMQFLQHLNIPQEKMVVYTDSLEDLPLIKKAGKAFLIKSSQKILVE